MRAEGDEGQVIVAYADGEPIYGEPERDEGTREYRDHLREHQERNPPLDPEESYVYFIQCEHGGPIKIGRAHWPRERLLNLQTGNPYRLVLCHVLEGGKSLEAELHQRFAAQRTAREWFLPSPELCELAKARQDEEPPKPMPRLPKAPPPPNPDQALGWKQLADHRKLLNDQRIYWKERAERGLRGSPKR